MLINRKIEVHPGNIQNNHCLPGDVNYNYERIIYSHWSTYENYVHKSLFEH